MYQIPINPGNNLPLPANLGVKTDPPMISQPAPQTSSLNSNAPVSTSNPALTKVLLGIIPLLIFTATGIISYSMVNNKNQQVTYQSSASAACPGSDRCNIPGQTQRFCTGNTLMTHDCGTEGDQDDPPWGCWTVPDEEVENCDSSGQICQNRQCVDPNPGGVCTADVVGDENQLNYSASDCVNKAWSATLYVCSTRACGNNAQYGVCHTSCDSTAQAYHLDGSVPVDNWSQIVRPSNFSGASVNCKLAQLDGAINTNNGQETGYTVIDNLGTCGGTSPTPTPTPTITPTLTPEPTLTPTPTGALVCDSLTSNNNNPQLGNIINLTCAKNANYVGAVTYDFRLIKKPAASSPNPNPLPTPFVKNSTNKDKSYQLPRGQYGFYRFQCRVCAGAFCTDWQNPPLPTATPIPVCGPNQTPSENQCSCAPGFGDCDSLNTNGCEADLNNGPYFCGACGTTCNSGQTCVSGVCQSPPTPTPTLAACPAPNLNCSNICVNSLMDLQNCGACGNACSTGQLCVAGACYTP